MYSYFPVIRLVNFAYTALVKVGALQLLLKPSLLGHHTDQKFLHV